MEAKDYVLRLPLQQMALRKMAILLWNRFCSDLLGSPSSTQRTLEFYLKKVKERVSLLYLPSSLKDELRGLLLPIGKEIQRWKEYHQSLLSLKVVKSELGQLCWTSQGTVDYRKTAERLIRLKRVNNINSYKLSCVYCFEEGIYKFWNELSESSKNRYFYEKTMEDSEYTDQSWRTRRAKLVTLWTCYLKGKTYFIINQYSDEPKRTFNQYAFESAAVSGNKAATEYFFKKLSFEEKEVSLIETIRRVIDKMVSKKNHFPEVFPLEKFSDVVIYLLSQMSRLEQTEVFEKHPLEILAIFMSRQWKDLFENIAEQMWTYLSIEQFRCLLMLFSYDADKPEVEVENMFMDFFLQAPKHYKSGLFANLSFESVKLDFMFPISYDEIPRLNMEWFCLLIKTNKLECIRLVIRCMDRTERERLILSEFGVELCQQLVKRDKWFILQLILEECELTKETKERLKCFFIECFNAKQKLSYKKRISIIRKDKFLMLIDSSAILSSKRRIEELVNKQSTSAKKKKNLK